MMARSRRGLAWIAALLALASLPIAHRDARAFDQGEGMGATIDSTLSQGPDFSGYQRLLDDYLSATSEPGKPLETRFDYLKLWGAEGTFERFARIRRQLFGFPISRLRGREKLAWAINTYNYLVLETATVNLIEKRAQRGYVNGMRAMVRRPHTSVQQIQLRFGTFFDGYVTELQGKGYSLNQFEQHFVFEDYDRKSKRPPPKTLDPRAHFALVCGAQGCPPLLPRAYQADSLDRQLDFAVRNALSSRAHLRFNPLARFVQASSIFQWYAADFGSPRQAMEFIKRYGPTPVTAEIDSLKVTEIGAYLPWDWKLKQTPQKAAPDSTSGRKS